MELNYLDLFKFYCIFSDLSHSGSCGCVGGISAEVPNLQTELNHLDLFKFYCIFSDLSYSSSCGCVGGYEWVWVCLGMPPHAPTLMHMHTCICTCITLKYTCILIANGCLHGGIHIDHV